jgi:glycosyltransferase involved in cell wall biosynthesis
MDEKRSGGVRGVLESKRIIWISELILDKMIQKTSQIEILRHLARRGYDVHLYVARPKKNFRMNHSNVHISYIPLKEMPLIQPFFYFVLLLFVLPIFCLRKRPRFIIAEPGLPSLAFIWKPLLSRCLRTILILDIRSIPVETEGTRGFLQSLVFDISILTARRFSNGLTTITPLMKEEISRRFHVDPEFIGVWTSGVSTSLFDPTKYYDEGLRLRKVCNLNGKFVVFYHGAFTHNRGITESVKAIAMLQSNYDDVVLFLLGDGPALPEIRKLVENSGLQDRVIIHGLVEVENVPGYIAMSDVGLVPLPNIPYWIHQCPLNLLEYLAMEKPVIATRIPANTAILGESRNAVYSLSAEPADIARAIAYSHDEISSLRRQGSCGRTIAKDKYNWGTVAGELENFLITRLSSHIVEN